MRALTGSPVSHLLVRGAALLGCVLAVSVCGEQGKFPTSSGGGTSSDVTPPVATVVFPTPAAGTVQDITDSLRFAVKDTDNVRLAFVKVSVSGVAPLSFSFADSSTFTTGVSFSKSYALPLPRGAAGNQVVITATAKDANNNAATPVVDTLAIVDHRPPALTLDAPAGGLTVGAGDTVKVIATAQDPSGISRMGAELYTLNQLNRPVVWSVVSRIYTQALVTKIDTFKVRVPASLHPGAYLIQAFAADSAPAPANADSTFGVGATVVVVRAPTGNFILPAGGQSVPAGDSVLVRFHAADSAGVARIVFQGFKVTGVDSLGTATTVPRFLVRSDSLPLPKDTILTRFLRPVLTDSGTGKVYITATVTNSGALSTTIADSVTVVSGPFVRVTVPAAGSRQPVGVPLAITVNGYSFDSIRVLGYTASGVLAGYDSTSFTSPLALTQTTTKSLAVAANARLGPDTIVPFATTSTGTRFLGQPVVIAFADTVKPVVAVQLPSKTSLLTVAVGDSVLTRVHVTDNKGVASLVLTGIAKRGVDSLGTATLVTRYVAWNITLPQSADTIITRYMVVATPIDSAGEFVAIIAAATDSSGNTRADTSQVRVVSGPRVSVVTPAGNAVTSPGKQLTIQVQARGGQGVHYLGYRAAGVFTQSDSVFGAPVNGALSDTLTFTSTVTIPVATPVGTFAVTAFAVDSTGNPSATIPGVVVTVVPVGVTDTIPPLVQFTVPRRVEAGDSISVTATDPSGITKVGYIARDTAGTILRRDSLTFAGTGTFITQKFRLALDTITTFPRVVKVEAFAADGATTPNRGVSVAPSSTTPAGTTSQAFQDTLTLVAGTTVALPQGGQFGDAVVNPNRNELYLTNTLLDRIEVFQLTTNSFASPIPVGARPVGIALWPRDTLGNNADTVIVANSGGTNLSIVDVKNRVERRRHRLPNYELQTVKTQTNAGGGLDIITTQYDFSDRPQYLGATCRHLAAAVCDSIVAVYSTTPTPAQPGPFVNRGYLAWENLMSAAASPSGHLFWELSDFGTDTIQIISVRDTAPGQVRRDTILGAGIGRLTNISTLAFQESTFVRNSGDFNHAVIGEGGLDQGFARALSFDGRAAVSKFLGGGGTGVCPLKNLSGVTLANLNCVAVTDSGISAGIFVRDFLINRASKVRAVSTNFNGRTNLVRADSIYAFDFTLRQTGLMQVGGTNSGMDMDPNNRFDAATRGSGGFGGSLNPNDRLVFAARPDASIDVFDTYWYGRVATIPIRDTIIGPVRVANTGGVLVLAGVTSRGVVVVRLPNLTNPFPVQRPMVAEPSQPRPPVASQPASTGKRAGAQP